MRQGLHADAIAERAGLVCAPYMVSLVFSEWGQ